MTTHTISPSAGNITIDVSENQPNVAQCRVFLFDPAHNYVELTSASGLSVPWQCVLPNPPASYQGYTVVCYDIVTDPSNGPVNTYDSRLRVSQTGNGDTTDQSSGPFDGNPTAKPLLSIHLA